jgi:dihydrolipoamide dehydrogenase
LEDEEVSNELQKSFLKRGIKIFTETRVQKIESTTNGVTVRVAVNEGEKILEAEQALVAIGFKPNSSDLGLEEIGVELTGQKHIKVDEHMSTNLPGIWAIGDVTGKLLLAHVASAQGILCVETMAGRQTRPINYVMVPRTIYSHPQAASFGFTEAQARESGNPINIGKFPFQANGKALGLGDSIGFVKIIVDKNYGEILGAHMIGAEVSELLPELTLAQQNELTITEIIQNIHAHPTLTEAIMEAAGNSEGTAIHI